MVQIQRYKTIVQAEWRLPYMLFICEIEYVMHDAALTFQLHRFFCSLKRGKATTSLSRATARAKECSERWGQMRKKTRRHRTDIMKQMSTYREGAVNGIASGVVENGMQAENVTREAAEVKGTGAERDEVGETSTIEVTMETGTDKGVAGDEMVRGTDMQTEEMLPADMISEKGDARGLVLLVGKRHISPSVNLNMYFTLCTLLGRHLA